MSDTDSFFMKPTATDKQVTGVISKIKLADRIAYHGPYGVTRRYTLYFDTVLDEDGIEETWQEEDIYVHVYNPIAHQLHTAWLRQYEEEPA